MAFVVGNGRRVSVWRDRWCEDEPLRDAFPSSFAIATSKEAWVEKVWDGSIDEGCWASRFIRPFDNWELKEAESFLLRLHHVASFFSPYLEWIRFFLLQ